MLVDHERAWLRLKAEIDKKRSHGQRDLHALLNRLEVECMIDDDPGVIRRRTEGPLPPEPARSGDMPTRSTPLAAQGGSNGRREHHTSTSG
jgi:hypothetical protein